MEITILYDNESRIKDLIPDWGFSCLIRVSDRNILFDTGANGRILLHNMKALDINPKCVDDVVISHIHFDHSGGLSEFLNENNNATVYVPPELQGICSAKKVVYVNEPMELGENIYTTGMLKGIEQSLAVKVNQGIVIIAGCSHPGVGDILKASAEFGKPYAIIGGLHGFNEFDLINELSLVCPTHCTQYIAEIQSRYPDKYIRGGVGEVIEI